MLENLRLILTESASFAHSPVLVECILLLAVALGAVLTYYISKYVLYGLEVLIEATPVKWDDILFDKRLMRAVAQLAPALTVNYMLPTFVPDNTPAHHWIGVLTSLYILSTVVYIVCIILTNLYHVFLYIKDDESYEIDGIVNMMHLITICVGIIIGISIIFNKQPAAILTALGASAAVLMLVFKDTIMGLVASVQFSLNQMLRKGDWIICDAHNINGVVEKVSLTTIKIKNWDNSISTIPPYTLVSDTFRNYQNMVKEGGRRVDRSVLIDATTIRYLNADEISELARRGRLGDLSEHEAIKLTNTRLLRRYLEGYLNEHDEVVHTMLCMVRQLELTARGLPIQLYFFTSATDWKSFEEVQGNILDHAYAVIGEFGLRIFQSETNR